MPVKQVHVVICEVNDASAGSGGWEWRLSLKDALREFYTFRDLDNAVWLWEAVDVPAEFQNDPAAISEWLDAIEWDSESLDAMSEALGARPTKTWDRRIVAE